MHTKTRAVAAGCITVSALFATIAGNPGVAQSSRPRQPIAAVSLPERLAAAEDRIARVDFHLRDDGTIVADGHEFKSWTDYFTSEFFQSRGLRCATPPADSVDPQHPDGAGDDGGIAGGSTTDCSTGNTSPSALYDPAVMRYRIPVVVHVIRNASGSQGNISTAMVQSQIDILNEDFRAISGTPGAPGANTEIEFYLANYNPSGNPTTGINYYNNDCWYNDGCSYWNSIAWTPSRYLNIYTNQAGGALGYVPFLPSQGGVGSASDRVVVLWSTFGRNAPLGAPYNQGRTATHEVGHYLGLHHTFNGGCGTTSSPGCYTTGDRICDTPGESTHHFGCATSANTCTDPGFDPVRNYLAYSDDTCMNNFTPEQARRMRCTLEHWRVSLARPLNDACALAPLAGNGATAFNTLGATTDGATITTCGLVDSQITADVWFRYVATCTGSATIDVCNATFDTRLAVYSGATCPTVGAVPVACNDNACGTGGSRSSVSFPVVAGQGYRIRIGGASAATGSGTMNIACTTPPACPGDTNNSGAVDVDDLVAVILGWGVCPNPSDCPADVAPPGGNDIVDVDDLITVILEWGPC